MAFERFPDELDLRKRNGFAWRLLRPFRFYSAYLGWIRVPAGFETDLASVPFGLRGIVSRDGDQTKPAVIHDYLYVRASEPTFPDLERDAADLVFLEALAVRGVGGIKRRLMYAAVRIGGVGSFRND